MLNQPFRRALIALFALTLGHSSASAQSTLYWTDASLVWATNSGTWATNSEGSGTRFAWVNGDSAVFSAGTALTNTYTITNSGVIVDNITVEEGRIHVVNNKLELKDASVTYNVVNHTSGDDYDLRIDSTIINATNSPSSITKSGAGILMLTGTNSYTGGTTVTAGMLSWKNTDAAFGSGTVTLGGGSFLHNATNGDTTVSNALHVTGNTKVGTRGGNVYLKGSLTGSGTFDVSNNSSDFDGLSISSASVVLTNNDLSGFTGTIAHTTLASGGNRLDFGPTNTIGNITIDAANAKINLSGSISGPNTAGVTGANYGTFKIGELSGTGGRIRAGQTSAGNTTFEVGYLNTSSTFGGVIANYDTGSAGLAILHKVGAGTLTLTNANTFTGGTTILQGELVLSGGNNRLSTSGSMAISNGATLNLGNTQQTFSAFNGSGAVINSGGLTINNASSNSFNGSISGGGGLTKNGLGVLTLSGTNHYTGTTTANAGSIVINGSIAGALSVAANTTLGGSGTIAGLATISGTHSPGNSPGIQTFSAGLTYETGSTFVWELIANTASGSARGTSYDGVNVTGGTLSIGTGVNTSLVFNASGSTVAWNDSLWATNQQWLVFSNTGTTTGNFSSISLSTDINGASLSSIRSGASFSWTSVNNDIYLNYTAVPEPSTYALLLLGAGLLTVHLRRRQKNAAR